MSLLKLPSAVGLEGVGALDSLLFGLLPSVTKEHFPRFVEDFEGTQVPGGFYEANINRSLLKIAAFLTLRPAELTLIFPLQFPLAERLRAGSLKGVLFLKWAVCKIVDLLTSP